MLLPRHGRENKAERTRPAIELTRLGPAKSSTLRQVHALRALRAPQEPQEPQQALCLKPFQGARVPSMYIYADNAGDPRGLVDAVEA